MNCPFCKSNSNKVIDSRTAKDGDTVRRRRECLDCCRRFTTYEYIEKTFPMIIKKDGRRELFNREKILSGITKACEKRNISINIIEKFINEIEKELIGTHEKEISSKLIGEKVMAKLHEIDDVAYVRFASVYREFKDISDFVDELKNLLAKDKK
ncbi:MAG: transcriptional regulator NrdR [Desulfobacterales bacterium]|nr:transcriptional regulator NrdR [Desulfobacterales bacterium]MBF0398240.1 transcriptional regulator NrdR [Desulfobacterales bacterium]